MARQIKYRAWVQEYNPSKEAATMVYSDRVGGVSVLFRDFEGDSIMQFTGLKDCDGVEIYEGDLVSVFDRDDKQFLTSGVVKFGFRGYPGFDIYDERGDTYTDEYNTFTNDDDLYFKVTGNIYQNPERFKDATKSK